MEWMQCSQSCRCHLECLDGAKNAAILAAKILAAGDDAILEKIKKYTADMKAQVVAKDAKLKQVGYKQYLAEK